MEAGSFQEGCPGFFGRIGNGGEDTVDAWLVQQAADTGPERREVKGFRGRGKKAIDTDRSLLGEEGFREVYLDRGMYFQQEEQAVAVIDEVGAKDVVCGGFHVVIDLPEPIIEKWLRPVPIERCAK